MSLAKTRIAARLLAVAALAALTAGCFQPMYAEHADGFAAQGLFYCIKGQNGSLNFRILGSAGHCDLTPFLAVDLNHQRYGVFNQQISFDLGPIRLGNQAGLCKQRPALLGQMRHHRRKQLNENDCRFPDRPGEIRWSLSRTGQPGAGQDLAKRVGKFPDIGQADVEMQPFDAR